MSGATYIHGTNPEEQARLVALNALTNQAFIDFVRIPGGSRVLEVGSGLGILASAIATGAHATVIGVEFAWPQLSGAATHPNVRYVQGDAHQLPLRDNSVDVAYARYVLEHVRDPQLVLVEIRRALRPGGVVALLENDITLIRFDPPCPAFEDAWAAFGRLQQQLGGDATIGRRLFRLLRTAGFADVELSFQPEAHWHSSPGFQAWVMNIIGNLASAQAALVESGMCSPKLLNEAMAELASLTGRPDASAGFTWNRARAIRPTSG